MKTLIVDDSAMIRNMIQHFTAEFNLDIVGEAKNGKEAMQVFADKKPELVTLDITMPEMDGLECLEAMLKANPNTRIIIITAVSDEGTGLQALEMGAKSFILKPFTADSIKAEFKKVMGK